MLQKFGTFLLHNEYLIKNLSTCLKNSKKLKKPLKNIHTQNGLTFQQKNIGTHNYAKNTL